MNSPETQPEPDSGITYVDPEQMDLSEQQFAVSLEQRAGVSSFVVEAEGIAAKQEIALPTEPELKNSDLGSDADVKAEMPVIAAPGHTSSKVTSESTSGEESPDWRDLVSAKVSSYRSRRPRKERYPSLQLHFEIESVRRTRQEYDQSAFENIPEPERPVFDDARANNRPVLPPVVLETTARVLEFPRPIVSPTRTDELAEPVLARPRIIEAPELLPPPPAMGGILIEQPSEPLLERRVGFDVPLQSAPLGRRAAAGIADAMLVAGTAAAFSYVVLRIIDNAMLSWRVEMLPAMGLLALLWAAYQYTFLVFCGKTPGLYITRLEIRKFDETPVPRNLRRWRALASILSLASLGLGYAWCFLDEDQLSWHDRITHTHLAPRSQSPPK